MYKPEAIAAVGCILSLLIPYGMAAAQPPAATPQPPAEIADDPGSRITPEDVLEISVLGEPELTKTITVPANGKISYPYSGEFKVAGLTVREVIRFLTTKLTKQLVDPQISVEIVKRPERYVSILGAVKTPGKVAIKEGWRVLNVLAESGGLSVSRVEWVTATLVRESGETVLLNLTQLFTNANQQDNIPVNPGDIILVKEVDISKTQVQVLGAVDKQGAYTAPSDGSIVAAIAAAGGTTPQAALSRAIIRRDGKDIPVDLTPLVRAGQEGVPPSTGADIPLKPGDTLFIPQNTRKFAVLGAVTRPGALEYPEGRTIDVLEALSLVGGQTRDADLKGVVLMRASTTPGQNAATLDTSRMVTLDLWSELRRRDDKAKGSNKVAAAPSSFKLNPGDVLLIPDKGSSTRTGFRDMIAVLPALGWLVR